MKMNKIIIPTVAIAMGAALVGSVSSTLAWYQYSTKAQAAFIGTSVGQSENLEIKLGNKWKTNLTSNEVKSLIANNADLDLVPVSTGAQDKDSALPAIADFHNSIETGVSGYGENKGTIANNVVQFTLNIRYKKVSNETSYEGKVLKLVDLTIADAAKDKDGNNQTNAGDLFKAIRVQFSTDEKNRLYARDDTNLTPTEQTATYSQVITTNTYGNLDTGNNGDYDRAQAYEWETSYSTYVIYGVNNTVQTAYNTAYADNLGWEVGTLPANDEDGLAVTVTIWLEGWQKLSHTTDNNKDANSSAIWDPLAYVNKNFNVGMRFEASDPQQPDPGTNP